MFSSGPGGFTSGPVGFSSRVAVRSTSVRAATTSVGPASHTVTHSVELGPTGCAVPGASALETLGWSTGPAPAWKHASRGLCIREGYCHNLSCAANGKKVICNLGFTTLDLITTEGRCRCPCCSIIITPVNAAFNNCEWTLEGIKIAHPGAQPETVERLEWETVGNTYSRFKPDPTDQSTWIQLHITTHRPSAVVAPPQPINTGSSAKPEAPQLPSTGSNQVVCSICCGEPFSCFGATAINTPCGHCYHRACLKPWVQRGRGDCPTCRRDISCLTPELLLQP